MDYSAFLASAEPRILALDDASILLDRDAYWAISDSADARRVLSSKYVLTDVAEDYFDIQASFSYALQESKDEGPVTFAIKIECKFTAHFHASPPVSKDFAKQFAESDSWLIFWPYFRQFVSDTTARMAVPPVVVPLTLGPGEYSYRRKSLLGAGADSPKPAKKRGTRKTKR